MTSMVKISRRPMSIKADRIHLTIVGRILHDMVGPISRPRVGPTLLPQLKAMVMCFIVLEIQRPGAFIKALLN